MFGADDHVVEGNPRIVTCEKNFFIPESCSMEFVRNLIVGRQVTSAGDWGERFEFGLSDDLMLAIEPNRLQIYRTRNPPEDNLL